MSTRFRREARRRALHKVQAGPARPFPSPRSPLCMRTLRSLGSQVEPRFSSLEMAGRSRGYSSTAVIESALSIGDLERHFAGLLTTSGWTRATGSGNSQATLSVWRKTASEAPMQLTLTIAATTGGDTRRDLVMAVTMPSTGNSGMPYPVLPPPVAVAPLAWSRPRPREWLRALAGPYLPSAFSRSRRPRKRYRRSRPRPRKYRGRSAPKNKHNESGSLEVRLIGNGEAREECSGSLLLIRGGSEF